MKTIVTVKVRLTLDYDKGDINPFELQKNVVDSVRIAHEGHDLFQDVTEADVTCKIDSTSFEVEHQS